MNPGKTDRPRNDYVSISVSMFHHVRSTFFENPNEPAVVEFVCAVLEEEHIDTCSYFEINAGKPPA